MSADGTPDLAAVVARVQEKLDRATSSDCRTSHYFEMRNSDGEFVAAIHEDDLRTLLAAVSRPAEARGEPSEAMVEAYRDADMCADSLLDTHTAHWCPKCIASGLRAALAAQRVQTP